MKKPIDLNTPLLYAGIIAIGMLLGYNMHGTLRYNANAKTYSGDGNLNEIIELVNDRYVDSIGTDSIELKAIDKLLAQLDPHSVYIPPQELKQVDEDLDGEFDGIGIEFFMQRDTMLVTSVIAGGPSEDVGINSGDKIFKVNDSIIAGKKVTNETIMKLLRGLSGSKVNVHVVRSGKTLKPFAITRGKIPMYSVDASYMLDEHTGYIKINRFAANTYEEFLGALKKLKGQGLLNLVIDLRDNPGGFLDQAVSIVDELITGTKTIVYTKGRNKQTETYKASKPGIFESGKLCVLIDEGSASAAEILSGALQDYDRATIVGRRSFGKGLVQEQYPLSNGGALRLTVARYFIPSGRCIQKDYSKGLEAYENDIMDRYKHGEMQAQDSTKYNDTTIYKTLGGRTVYGGGGIMPDEFVPFDNNKFTPHLSDVLASSIINEVSNDYYSNAVTELKKYKNIQEYNTRFEVPASVLQTVKNECLANEIAINSFSNDQDILFIKKRIKSIIAKSLFGNQAQYIVNNTNDEFIEKALKQFKK
jgi:carboxyl-terminal processing protease